MLDLIAYSLQILPLWFKKRNLISFFISLFVSCSPCVCLCTYVCVVNGRQLWSCRISLHIHWKRTAELHGALFKNVNYGNRSHKEFGSMRCILQVTVTRRQVGMLIGTLRGTFKCVQCTRVRRLLQWQTFLITVPSLKFAHTDSKLGCFWVIC